jgi:hypothetical protein
VPRITYLLAFTAALCACSKSQSPSDETSSDTTEAPAISPTSAPGVAFNYRYDFQIRDGRISSVQEQHAARCEAMGVARCRITGLGFEVGEDDRVTASLQVKLAPEIARQFGKDASADVAKADGRLVRTEFEGTDTQPTTEAAGRSQASASSRIAELDRQIADPRTKDRERAELRSDVQQLRDQLDAASATVAAQQQLLASTPMTLNYYGAGGIPGFGHQNPIAESFKLFVQSAVTMIGLLLKVVAVILPWAALLLLLLLFFRSRVGRRIVAFVRPAQRADDNSE